MSYRMAILVLCVGLTCTQAETYYISPTGNNGAPGTISQPWATISYAMSANSPVTAGDTVYVRGGIYNEKVTINKNGTPGNIITLSSYPGENAILDGSRFITGWQACSSQEDAFGNPNWRHIYKVTLSLDKSLDTITLFENGQFMYLAQQPNQTERVYQDVVTYMDLKPESEGLTDGLIDSSYLTQADDYWNGCTVYIWSQRANNVIIRKTVKDFISSQNKITFDVPLDKTINSAETTKDKYSLANHIDFIDKAGEYCYIDKGNNNYTIYCWPEATSSITNSTIGYSYYNVGIIAGSTGMSFITISNFEIRGYATSESLTRDGGIVVPSGFTHKYLTLNNLYIHENAGGGISVSSSSHDTITNNTIKNIRSGNGIGLVGDDARIGYNTIHKVTGTGIAPRVAKRAIIYNNTISDLGVHGNGIAAYQNNEDILIAYNAVSNKGLACTISTSKNIVIYSNLFYTTGTYCFADWGGMTGHVRLLNNIIQGSGTNTASREETDEYVFFNNIIDGGCQVEDRSHNIYTKKAWYMTSSSYKSGEMLVLNKDSMYINPDMYNFETKAGSPSINSGTSISHLLPTSVFPDFDFNKDIRGSSRVQDGTIDIGPYEYVTASSTLYSLTIDPPINGTVTKKIGEADTTATAFSAGTKVILTAKAAPGYRFAGWSGDASGTAESTTITMDRNKLVTASFIRNSISDGLVFHSMLDDFSEATIADITNAQLTANLIGGPLWGAGWRDEDWLGFNQSTQAISIPTMGMSPEAGTIAVWVEPTDFSGMKFIFGHVLNNANRLSLYTVAGSLAVGLGSNATLKTNITPLSLNQPVHLALSWEGTAYAVYVNGVQKAAGTFSGLTALNTFIDIGNYGDPAFRSLGFAGKIDDIRAYNRALAAEEIDALYLTHDVRQGKDLQFTVNAVNAQGIPIVYQVSAMPAGASFDAATQSVRWTPWHNQLGLHTFRFTATGQPEKIVNVEVHPSSMTSWYTLGQGQLTKVR